MFLTEKLRSAQREAAERVARGRSYSLALPIVGRVPVPSPEQLAIYAALGGLAVLELIDWPVALAMGVGTAVVGRHLSDLAAREDELADAIEADAAETAERPAPAKKAPARKAPARKAPARKTPARKTPAKKAPAKKAGGPSASRG